MEHQNKNIMFYDICRLCLDEHGHCDIFDKNLQENIFRCIGVKVSLVDSLPQKICAKCLEIVTKAAGLRNIAKRNDERLKILFHCPESKTSMDICKEEEELLTVSTTVNSSHFEEDKNTSREHPAIAKFISVRKDLFESSVSEHSLIKTESFPHKDNSSQNFDSNDIVKCDNGDTIYKCSHCSKTFNTCKKLYLHNRLHNRNYRCPVIMCGKKFATRSDLEKHYRTHTGEKPYQCDQCDKSFTQRGTLKSHKENIHSEGTINKCESDI